MDRAQPRASAKPFNAFSDAHAANPFPLFALIRSRAPIVPILFPVASTTSTNRAWLVTRMDEAVQIFKDYVRFTVDSRAAGITLPFDTTMLSVDPPDHRRIRGMVSKVFTPTYMEGLRPRVQQIADSLLDRVQHQGYMDVVEDYAFPLPINVIADMLGVSQSDWPVIRQLSDTVAATSPIESAEATRRAHDNFRTYLTEFIARKRLNPGDDLTSQLLAIEEGDDRLTDEELVAMIGLLIFAGHETTANLLGIATLMLLDHPDQLAPLRADLSLMPAAVEELLRFNSPLTISGPRFATEDLDIGGRRMRRGDMIIIALVSANRDERQFGEADKMNIARPHNKHVAFGHGIHFCLGAPLARIEAVVALTTLLQRMPNLRLAVDRDTIEWRVSLNFRGLRQLPIAF